MKNIVSILVTAVVLTSCVTKKKFTELSDKYNRLSKTNAGLISQNDELLKNKNKLASNLENLQEQKSGLDEELKALQQKIAASKNNYNQLQSSYDNLSSNSSSAINAKVKENQKLLSELESKEKILLEEKANLKKLKEALEARSKRISDLEALIASKEAAMQKLKNAISEALVGFEGKGLTVENRDGKIYVSMENKLLFKSGQWAVGANGKNAVVKLAEVLVNNPTINVLIEGHTDNDPYNGSVIKDNWDLSVKRATAIVRILQRYKVSPKQITAAGRSEYLPVAPNSTTSGKAKNRRIEIILSPNLDEVTKLLNE